MQEKRGKNRVGFFKSESCVRQKYFEISTTTCELYKTLFKDM